MLKSKGYYQENYVFLVFWKIFMETLKKYHAPSFTGETFITPRSFDMPRRGTSVVNEGGQGKMEA